jgi:hypothetical protein
MTARPRHAIAIASFAALAVFLSACAHNANYPWDRAKAERTAEAAEPAPAPNPHLDADRKAILAMAGDYHVVFSFRETVPFVAGYTPKKPTSTEGDEIVRVIKDDGNMISLQHTLVSGEGVIKHWRQDWIYEPKEIFAFVGRNTWERRELSAAERRGKWAQLVYQVDDGPRYASLAPWVHENGVSSWTGAPTLRPLPRRDATKRDDYDAILCVNRHAITPAGWVHEQDNTKLVMRGTPQALVREVGLNTYTRSKRVDAASAERYWQKTGEFWAEVRDTWLDLEKKHARFGLTIQGEPSELYDKELALADAVEKGEKSAKAAAAEAKAVIAQYVTFD